MKKIYVLLLILLSTFCCLQADEPARPNIILILADDLGWKDVGYQGITASWLRAR